MSPEQEAKFLAEQGYAITSRKSCMASRIDREDWHQIMAEKQSPWDPLGEGGRWVDSLGYYCAADFYRRCHSKDKITVSEEVRKHMPKSGSCDFGYRSIKIKETIVMEQVIKCFHLNDPNFHIPSKCGNEIHHKSTRKYWGHIVTNAAKRTDRRFAMLFDPEGKKINTLTYKTFKTFTKLLKHEYVKTVSEEEFCDLLNLIPSLSKSQAPRLLNRLSSNCYIIDARSQEPGVLTYRFMLTDTKE